jgi:predicted Zn-dependent protease
VADVRRLEGEEGTWWRYGEAGRLLLLARRGDAGGLTRARELVADLERRRPGWPRAALLVGCLHELGGESSAAAEAYLRAFRGGGRRPGLAENLVRLLAEQGRLDDADEVIRRSQQQVAPSPELARLGAEIALRQRRNDRARELARLAVLADSADHEQLIWLGQVLAAAGRQTEAEDVLRQAVRRRGDLAETWVALVAHLARGDHAPEAVNVRDEMQRSLPADQVPLASALCAEALGQAGTAGRFYHEALERSPDDALVVQKAAQFHLRLNQAEQAEALLRRLLAPGANVSAASRAWARRRLALLLAFGGGDGLAQATALLDENERLKQGGLLDRRARLLVEAAHPERRADALRRLEESAKAQPFTAEELVCLVRLYEEDNDADAARERMLDLLALDRDNPEYLARHIDRLLRRGRKDDARPWVARLQNLEPGSSRVEAYLNVTR